MRQNSRLRHFVHDPRQVIASCLVVVLVGLLPAILTGGVIQKARPSGQYQFGDAHPGLPVSGPSTFVEFPITDAYAVTEARRTSGDAVARRMVHRVTTTMTYADGVRFGFDTSGNWGGWAADTTNYPHLASGAYGAFYAQTVCSSCNLLGSWIGIGGYRSSNIAQAGYDEKRRQAWYELYPNAPVYIGIYPVAGDQLFVNVHLDLSTFNWYIAFDDITTSLYWSSEFAFSVTEDTAEWITELASGTTVPASNNVLFWDSQWLDENGTNQPGIVGPEDSAFNITLIAPSCGTITPSALSNGYQQFTDYVQGC